jgi:hypothetical protein
MKTKKSFMSATLMASCFIFAFRFNNQGIEWFWEEQEMIPIILVACTLIFGLLWCIESRKQRNAEAELK